jgi:hypothetical protein
MVPAGPFCLSRDGPRLAVWAVLAGCPVSEAAA